MAKLAAELDKRREAMERGAKLRARLDEAIPSALRETLPEMSSLLAGLLADDPASIANAAHMTMERQVAKAELEAVAIEAGAKKPDEDT